MSVTYALNDMMKMPKNIPSSLILYPVKKGCMQQGPQPKRRSLLINQIQQCAQKSVKN